MLNRGLYRKSLCNQRTRSEVRISCVSGPKNVACAVPQSASHLQGSGSHPGQSIRMVDTVALDHNRSSPDHIIPQTSVFACHLEYIWRRGHHKTQRPRHGITSPQEYVICMYTCGHYFIWQMSFVTCCRLAYRINVVYSLPTTHTRDGIAEGSDKWYLLEK
jgi:hypothetical protein